MNSFIESFGISFAWDMQAGFGLLDHVKSLSWPLQWAAYDDSDV